MRNNELSKLAVQTGMEIIPFGPYPRMLSGSQQYNIDVPGVLIMNKIAYPTILMGYGEEIIKCLSNLVSFHIYAADIEIKLSNDKVYKAKVDKFSTFNEVFKGTIEDRIKQVLNQYTHVALADSQNHLSKMEKDDDGNNKEFVDRADLKVVKVCINKIDWDNDVVTLGINDGAFPYEFHARIDPLVFQAAMCGKGSFVYLIGTLEKNYQDQSIMMNVCAIIPIVRKPLQAPAANVLTGRIPIISME